MKTKIFIVCMFAAFAALVTGCVETVDGHTEPGVPFVQDKVVGRYDRPLAQVLDASRAVIKFNGQLIEDDIVNNALKGRVDQMWVFVRVSEVQSNTGKAVTQVTVQARNKFGGSNVNLAHEIEKQIALQLVGH